MSQMIGSTYEVIKTLGSGGGGVVYLANHVRLNKRVVLKADKRKITTKPELLRREVDVLKNLSHPYIPQVYDFFVEGETVYTAMDFIDGESLDRPLKRGERFTQPQIIKWATQILSALDYLHSPTHGDPPRGYVHSDIKPANIMLRENGDICLIDFNISLALGEESVIGASAGYASPEHYGLDFSFSGGTQTINDQTLPLDDGTETLPISQNSTYSKPRKIIPDVRSDIYSVGATLYHLLSGKKPARNAQEVIPLDSTQVSQQIIQIITKAMNPNPDLRYQTAAEMLWDFEHLHENDPRMKRLKRQSKIAAAILAVTFLSGGAMALAGNTQLRHEEAAARVIAEEQAEQERLAKETEQTAKDALELVQRAQAALEAGDTDSAQSLALSALEKDTQYNAAAQYALAEALGVYDPEDGYKAYKVIELPSEIIKQIASPDGAYAAVLTSGRFHVIDLADGTVVAELPTGASALKEGKFLNDTQLLYTAENTLCAYDIKTSREMWSTDEAGNDLAVSGDGKIAAVSGADGAGANLYLTESGEPAGNVMYGDLRRNAPVNAVFADPENDVFTLDETGRYLAVSFANGALKLFDTKDADGEIEIFDQSEYTFFEGGFYGRWFGFVASDGSNSDFYAIDMDKKELAGSMSVPGTMRLRVDADGFCLSQNGVLVRLDIDSGEQTELAFTESGIAAIARASGVTLLKASDGKLLFYDENAILFDRHDGIPCDFLTLAGQYAILSSRDSASVRVMKLTSHADRQLAAYAPSFMHDEARVNSNRESVMLYSYQSFRICGMNGDVLHEQEIPDAAEVYDQQYRRSENGDYLEVIYNDGLTRCYAANDGAVIFETQGERRNDSLDEEFVTGKFRIEAPLHGTPTVYDKTTNKVLAELQSDDYMVYATDVEGGIIAEFINSQGQRYGLLLNEQMETLAKLPNLCDILPDGTLVFDNMRGELRESRIYSIQELTALAQQT